MATMQATYSRGPRLGLMLVLIVLVVLVLAVVPQVPWGMPKSADVQLPELSPHALRHEDAQAAWRWVEGHGRFCRYDCNDGRTRYVCAMPQNRWAIVVLEAGQLITAFTGDQDYAKGAMSGCRNPWHFAHP